MRMQKVRMGVIFIVLLSVVTTAYAAELTPETGCCLDFESGLTLPEECNQYEINEERCDDIIARYKAVRDTPIYMAIAIAAVLAFVTWLVWHLIKKRKK